MGAGRTEASKDLALDRRPEGGWSESRAGVPLPIPTGDSTPAYGGAFLLDARLATF